MEWVAQQYGWRVMFSPKAHPEIAGCGIEYVWAACKNWLQLVSLEDRKGRDKFDGVFRQCFDTKVTARTVRGSTRAAREYMHAYLVSHAEQLPPTQDGVHAFVDLNKAADSITLKKIEKMRKRLKTHRSVADINQREVRVILKEAAVEATAAAANAKE